MVVTGPGGNDSEVKTGYIVVNAPPVSGISDGSFETQIAGLAPFTPWTTVLGGGHLTLPDGQASDNGMPTQGTNWCELDGDGSNAATPPTNPGGAGTAAVGGAGISQSLSYVAGQSVFAFEASFVSAEMPNQVTFNDFMSVDITDGTTSHNLFYRDTFSTFGLTSVRHGDIMTPVVTVSVDLATLFPSSTPSTVFTITAVVGNGADNMFSSHGYVDDFRLGAPSIPAPVADFVGTPTSGQTPLIVNFGDMSTGSINSYLWTFGDGGTSTAVNPSHTYTTAGTYSVTLTVTGPGGNDQEAKTGYITVQAPTPPTADFTATQTMGMAPHTVMFTDQSIGGVGTWSWNFGDGNTSTAQSPAHTYTTAGNYTVTLTVTGPGGSDTETKVDFVTVTNTPVSTDLMYMSFTTTTIVPSLGFAGPEDVVAYDPVTGQWSMYFDGSDVGLTANVDAVHVLDTGAILLSFAGTSTIPGLINGPSGTSVSGSDVVYFGPSSLGSTTAGSFFFVIDGSDVGLDTTSEDIDGLYLGQTTTSTFLLISTNGTANVPGVSNVDDADVMYFIPATFGLFTTGDFGFLFDGTDIGLNAGGEDIDALSLDGAFRLLFSTMGDLNASGLSADGEDVVRFAGGYGVNTAGSLTLVHDLSGLGIVGNVNAISISQN